MTGPTDLATHWHDEADTSRKSMTLEELTRSLERRARDAEQVRASAPVADVLRTVLSELSEIDADDKDITPRHRNSPDRLLTASQAAPLLGQTRRWMYDHAGDLPFAKRLGTKNLRFSEHGLLKWMQQR